MRVVDRLILAEEAVTDRFSHLCGEMFEILARLGGVAFRMDTLSGRCLA